MLPLAVAAVRIEMQAMYSAVYLEKSARYSACVTFHVCVYYDRLVYRYGKFDV
jgi:hypothetical protein